MKILFITNNLTKTSGWERYGFELVSRMQDSNEIFAVVESNSDAFRIEKFPILRQPQEYLFSPINWLKDSSRINKIIEIFDPDVIHFLVEPYVQLLPFLRLKSRRVILTIHGTYSLLHEAVSREKRFFSKSMYVRALKKVDKISCVSNYTMNRFLGEYPKFSNKVYVIKSGASVFPRPDSFIVESVKHEYNLHGKWPILGTVGAVKHRKGQLDTLHAFIKIQQIYHDAIYIMVGSTADWSYVEKIRYFAKQNGIEDSIRIIDSVATDTRLSAIYSILDVFMLNSNNYKNSFEGFGLTILEANSFGKPAVGSMNCGIEDAIIEGVNGYRSAQGDSNDIAEKTLRVLRENFEAEKIVEFARSFTWQDTVNSYYNLYKS